MEQIEITEINKELSKISNNLLKKLTTKQLTLPEFLLECAYWYMDVTFNSISWKPNPTKTAGVRDFEKLSYKQRERLSDQYFEDNWQIDQYYESLYQIKRINVGNFNMMILVYRNIPEGDTINRGKLKEKIDFYNKKIEWHRDKKWIKIEWSKLYF